MKNPFIVMYHGGIVPDRGIEELINLVAKNENLLGIVLGNGQEGYLNQLRNMTKKLKVTERLLFHSAVSIDDLWKYVGAVDISLMMIRGHARSYYLSLPNKFFESVQALTPIVASDFPEMKNLIDKYRIGLTCDPENIEEINLAIEKMRLDESFYNTCKENLCLAKNELCWENEKEKLINAYNNKVIDYMRRQKTI